MFIVPRYFHNQQSRVYEIEAMFMDRLEDDLQTIEMESVSYSLLFLISLQESGQ